MGEDLYIVYCVKGPDGTVESFLTMEEALFFINDYLTDDEGHFFVSFFTDVLTESEVKALLEGTHV